MTKTALLFAGLLLAGLAHAGELDDAKALFEQKKYPEAMKLYTKLANAGNVEAQQNLGQMYWYGEAGEVDEAKATMWFTKAAAKGNKDAAWIAAATLDRYLQAIGQKQIYGTQDLNRRETGPTMEPYNRELVPDALREMLGVPVLEKQDARLNAMKAAGVLAR